jgi:hypothetical protein
MIKTAHDAYLAGRQEAMEKIAIVGIPDILANYLGKEEALAEGNKRARMSLSGVLAPTGYSLLGGGVGAGLGGALGAAIGAYNDRVARDALLGAGIGGGLGGLGGYGYGLYRAYKKPGEY